MSYKDKERLRLLLEAAKAKKIQAATPSAPTVPTPTVTSSRIDTAPTGETRYTPPTIAQQIAALRAAKDKSKADLPSQPVDMPAAPAAPTVETVETPSAPNNATATGMSGEAITYNPQQQEFIGVAESGQSCVLIGAAGTGKTTCTQGAIRALMDSGKVPILQNDGHSHLASGTPGVIIISFTRRAVNNIRKVQPEDLKRNCVTAHKLLEYQPEYFEVEDPETGELKNSMRFTPTRNSDRPLPSTIHTIVIEEASMLGTELFQQILDALSHPVQFIFIGDIQQLPPVFGPAILGFKMLELPVIELTEVYRQALESPIIRLAHRILSGKAIAAEEYPSWHEDGKLTLHPWKKKLSAELAVLTLGAFFKGAIEKDIYNPEEDMILIPFNVNCGTVEINKIVADYLARRRHAITHEVIAGFNKLYFSEGDKVLYDREDAEIVEIKNNPQYSGAKFQPASRTLDYWGHNPNVANESHTNNYGEGDDVDFLLSQAASSEDRVNQASHVLVLQLRDSGNNVEISTAGDLNNLLHGYALTIHKSQGSEWRRVFLCFHQSHAVMLQRELLYTGVTRAREELYVICEKESMTKGIEKQRIKGNSLEEKAEYFKGKYKKEDYISE